MRVLCGGLRSCRLISASSKLAKSRHNAQCDLQIEINNSNARVCVCVQEKRTRTNTTIIRDTMICTANITRLQ